MEAPLNLNSKWPAIILFAVLVAIVQQVVYEHAVNALANPITSVRNRRVVVTQTATAVPATGQKCNIVCCNVDVGTRAFPIYHGGLDPDGGLLTSTIGLPICDNSVNTFVACAGLCFSFDAVPSVISVIAGSAMPDGGIPIRCMEGTGCQSP